MPDTPMDSAGEYADKAKRAIRLASRPGLADNDRTARLAEAQVWATLALAAAQTATQTA